MMEPGQDWYRSAGLWNGVGESFLIRGPLQVSRATGTARGELEVSVGIT